jgi:hypothetical protein
MLRLEGRVARAELREQKELEGIVQGLAEAGFQPLLRSVNRAAHDVADLPERALDVDALMTAARRYRPSSESALIGDLFFRDGRAYALQPFNHALYAWEICSHTDECGVDAFHEAAEAVARGCLDGRRLRGMQFTWDTVPPQTPRRRYGLELAAPPTTLSTSAAEYTDTDVASARLLLDRSRRESLIRLAQMRGRVKSGDAFADAGSDQLEELETAGLIEDEYLVLCRGDNRTILTAPTQESFAESDLRCPVCSRRMSEELIQKVYAVTGEGQQLLAGSHWMTVWVTQLLESAGVPRDEIAWHGAAGDDEVDIILSFFGLQFFLELKDREFGMGDAYPFASRAARYGADAGAVLCTEKVAEEAKSYFADRSGMEVVPIETVEGEKQIESRLRSLAGAWSVWAIQRSLASVLEDISPIAMPILSAWMREQDRRSRTRRPPKRAPVSVPVAPAEPVRVASNGA